MSRPVCCLAVRLLMLANVQCWVAAVVLLGPPGPQSTWPAPQQNNMEGDVSKAQTNGMKALHAMMAAGQLQPCTLVAIKGILAVVTDRWKKHTASLQPLQHLVRFNPVWWPAPHLLLSCITVAVCQLREGRSHHRAQQLVQCR